VKIAVILGGTSAERDISIVTGLAIAKALRGNGHDIKAIDCAYGDKVINNLDVSHEGTISAIPSDIEQQRISLDRNIFETVKFLINQKFDIVFNALHGGYGENGQLQALLELARVPFTGSGSFASALGMNKHLSKILFQREKIATPPWIAVSANQKIHPNAIEKIGYPVVVKPNEQGSTVGLTIVNKSSEIEKALEIASKFGDIALIEKFIYGRELTVSILGDKALPVIEIKPKSGFYDYESKYQSGFTTYEVPAKLESTVYENLQQAGLTAYQSLGCEDYARVDFRIQDDNQFFCLEVNTLPGMTPTSLVPKAAKCIGIEFNQLIESIVKSAFNKQK